MIRLIVIGLLSALLVLVLYLPSAYPAQRFIGLMSTEHSQLMAFWSAHHAGRVLDRSLQSEVVLFQPASTFGAPAARAPATPHSAVGAEMSAVTARLFNSSYFRSADALLALATYRLHTLLEWLPWLALIVLAATVDATVARYVKARQFGHHNPEVFAACACGVVLLLSGVVVALVAPTTLPVWLFPVLTTAVTVLIAGTVRNFHLRG